MTDALAPWANLGMLVVVGGIVTLVLVAVALTEPGASPERSGVARAVGALGAVAAFAAGLAVTVVATLDPTDWWLDMAGWLVWAVGEVVVFAVMAALLALGRRGART